MFAPQSSLVCKVDILVLGLVESLTGAEIPGATAPYGCQDRYSCEADSTFCRDNSDNIVCRTLLLELLSVYV